MEYIVTRWPNSPSTATQQAAITITVNAVNHLEALNLSGLKEPGALKQSDVKLSSLNILIGPNGAGKSNFISFFKMLNEVVWSKTYRFN